jgi:hypothetical protein
MNKRNLTNRAVRKILVVNYDFALNSEPGFAGEWPWRDEFNCPRSQATDLPSSDDQCSVLNARLQTVLAVRALMTDIAQGHHRGGNRHDQTEGKTPSALWPESR